ncbi:hypothetical protein LY76DRAFT_684328 [Colletotrichum caudatum]|nr:hypothetical protein LY76DRAFT_684328 [Colletotrichum caudatum]
MQFPGDDVSSGGGTLHGTCMADDAQWISGAKRNKTAQPPTCRPHTPTATETESPQDLEFADQGQLDSLLTLWSGSFVKQSLEPVLDLAVGTDGCPLVTNPGSTDIPLGIELFRTLDAYSTKATEHPEPNYECEKTAEAAAKRSESAKQSLLAAAKAFTARWLPLILDQVNYHTDDMQEVIRKSWRASRNDMLKMMNRVSYESVLTLFIFSQTPIPCGISEEEEEEDGISGLVCLHTALLQVQRLRERHDGRRFCGSEVGTWVNATACAGTDPSSAERYLQLESRAYWAAVGWDTSASLAYNPGRSSWGRSTRRPNRGEQRGLKATDETARKVLSGAAVGSVSVWKSITSLKEALREGVGEDGLLLTWKSLLDAIDVYRASVCPLLNTCERQLHYLDQERRLCWFEASLQYHLGILTMVDALRAAHRSDLLAQVLDLGRDTESEIFSLLRFGTDSTYTIRRAREAAPTRGLAETTDAPPSTITTSLITVYPLISRVIDSVALTKRVVDLKHTQGTISDDVYSYLCSVLTKALGRLPQHRGRATLSGKGP